MALINVSFPTFFIIQPPVLPPMPPLQINPHLQIKKEPEEEFEVKTYTCQHCNYSTNWKSNLSKHLVTRHTSDQDINWLKCEYCEYKGKTKTYLKCHQLHSHNISVKWFECDQCPFKTKTKSHLDVHMNGSHASLEEVQWFNCEKCNFRTKFKTNLKQHMSVKHVEDGSIEWFKCELCNFKAKRSRYLKMHELNKHTVADRTQLLKCEKCEVTVKRKSDLKVHKCPRRRTREIPVFIDNRLCWRRIEINGPEEENNGNYECTQCNFKFQDKDIFQKHVLKEHVVTEYKQENDKIVRKSYKTKNVVVMVNNVPCIKKVIERELQGDKNI